MDRCQICHFYRNEIYTLIEFGWWLKQDFGEEAFKKLKDAKRN